MTMRVFHRPTSRSHRVVWMLEELGADYEVTLFTRADALTDEHRERHPLGRVPVLETDGRFVFESAALCLHLADSDPDAGLIPAPGSFERACVYQWTLFAMTEIEPGLINFAYGDRDGDDERREVGRQSFRAATAVLEDVLEGNEYLVGDRFSVADVVAGSVAGDGGGARGLLDGFPNVTAWDARLRARPARVRTDAIGG
jgi:glutathione S-transferase